MTAIEPNTPVRVVIEGTVTHRVGNSIGVHTDSRSTFAAALLGDPAVTVTPLDPERTTLDRETLADRLFDAENGRTGHTYCCSWANASKEVRAIYLARADAVLALIQAAHPEWTP